MVEEARGDSRPLLVDTMAEGLSPTILVEEARRAAPQIEFLMRFSGGVGSAMANLESRQVGRSGGRREAGIPFDGRHLVRLERWPTTAISIIPASNTFTAPPGRRSRGWDG